MHEHKRFDDEAATWDDDPSHEARQLAVAQAIKEAVSLSPSMSAVDVGGGTGRLSILLADLVGTVVVTDPSAGMVQVARERIEAAGLSDRLHAVQADLSTDRLDGVYDVVWSCMALHHVQDLDGLLRSVARLLVPGGRLLIADLDKDPDGAFHADKVDFDGHHGFDRQRLAEQLARAGFGDVHFADATTILKHDREFGVFLCLATKAPEPSRDRWPDQDVPRSDVVVFRPGAEEQGVTGNDFMAGGRVDEIVQHSFLATGAHAVKPDVRKLLSALAT